MYNFRIIPTNNHGMTTYVGIQFNTEETTILYVTEALSKQACYCQLKAMASKTHEVEFCNTNKDEWVEV